MEFVEKRVRAFVAVNVPPDWKAAFAEWQRELKHELRSNAFRWVNPEQIHLTLRFQGSIGPGAATEVSALLNQAGLVSTKLSLAVQGLGCFPNPRRARVLWAGIAGQTEELEELQHRIVQSTAAIGEPPDDRPFSPHLTLARIKEGGAHDLRGLPEILARNYSLPAFVVNDIHLMRSYLSPGGARYEALSAHRLGGAAKNCP